MTQRDDDLCARLLQIGINAPNFAKIMLRAVGLIRSNQHWYDECERLKIELKESKEARLRMAEQLAAQRLESFKIWQEEQSTKFPILSAFQQWMAAQRSPYPSRPSPSLEVQAAPYSAASTSIHPVESA